MRILRSCVSGQSLCYICNQYNNEILHDLLPTHTSRCNLDIPYCIDSLGKKCNSVLVFSSYHVLLSILPARLLEIVFYHLHIYHSGGVLYVLFVFHMGDRNTDILSRIWYY